MRLCHLPPVTGFLENKLRNPASHSSHVLLRPARQGETLIGLER